MRTFFLFLFLIPSLRTSLFIQFFCTCLSLSLCILSPTDNRESEKRSGRMAKEDNDLVRPLFHLVRFFFQHYIIKSCVSPRFAIRLVGYAEHSRDNFFFTFFLIGTANEQECKNTRERERERWRAGREKKQDASPIHNFGRKKCFNRFRDFLWITFHLRQKALSLLASSIDINALLLSRSQNERALGNH